MPSKERLSRDQFIELTASPLLKTVFNRLGTLKYTKTQQPKVSVVVSSKQEKRAVARNKLRRRVYTLFSQEKQQIAAILYVSKHAYIMEYDEIRVLFHDLLAKTAK